MSAQSLYTEWLTFLASEKRASPRTVRAYGEWITFNVFTYKATIQSIITSNFSATSS